MTQIRHALLLLVCTFGLSGCITEISGGLPPPAPDSERLQAQLDLGRGYLAQRDWARARGPLTSALVIDPKSVETHVLLAILYENEDEPGVAERHYKRALQLAPRDSQALNNYGTFLYGQGRYQDALVPLRLLVQDTEYNKRAQAYENLGLAELRVGNLEPAQAAFERALGLNFAQPRSSLELADLRYGEGNFVEAETLYRSYLNLARQNARSLCLGMKLSTVAGDSDRIASYGMALRNLYPRAADQCIVPK
jgi:type IV pilus assembly protein PilF